jgi:hypothetical protein
VLALQGTGNAAARSLGEPGQSRRHLQLFRVGT